MADPQRSAYLLDAPPPEREQHPRDVDADRTHLAARAAEAARLRQVSERASPCSARREHRTHGPGIHAAVRVAADLLVDGTRVQAGAAADAIQNLRKLTAQQPASPVVHEHDVQLVGTVWFAPRLVSAQRAVGP